LASLSYCKRQMNIGVVADDEQLLVKIVPRRVAVGRRTVS